MQQDIEKQHAKRTNRIIIAVFVIVSILIAGGMYWAFNQEQKAPAEDSLRQTTEVDPTTGEVLTTTEGKTPERYGEMANTPVLLGFQELLTKGAAFDDVDSSKKLVSDYIATNDYKDNSKVSLDPKTLKQSNDEGIATYTFDLVVNDEQRLAVKIVSNMIGNLTLTISDKSGNQLYTVDKTLE